ncbi:hypothetical protein [Chitinophaga sancti]
MATKGTESPDPVKLDSAIAFTMQNETKAPRGMEMDEMTKRVLAAL